MQTEQKTIPASQVYIYFNTNDNAEITDVLVCNSTEQWNDWQYKWGRCNADWMKPDGSSPEQNQESLLLNLCSRKIRQQTFFLLEKQHHGTP